MLFSVCVRESAFYEVRIEADNRDDAVRSAEIYVRSGIVEPEERAEVRVDYVVDANGKVLT